MDVAICFRNPDKLPPYEQALRSVGLNPVRISPDAARSLDSWAGLVLTGGTDINPARYNQQPAPETDLPDDGRDALETDLLKVALAQRLPVLAICRGMQLFNVVHGGTLIQHLPPNGPHQVKARDAVAHTVKIQPGTRLASILQASDCEVNSRHHQAVDRPGNGLIVSAISRDGIVEALETPGDSFAVAVQWHPEDRISVSESDRRLFFAFAEACSARAEAWGVASGVAGDS